MVQLIEKIKDTPGKFHSWWKSDVGIIRKPNSSIKEQKVTEIRQEVTPKVAEPIKQTKIMKPFYKSKEVWVLGIAVLIMLAKFIGLDFLEIAGEAGDVATSTWLGLAPLAALIIRIVWTKEAISR